MKIQSVIPEGMIMSKNVNSSVSYEGVSQTFLRDRLRVHRRQSQRATPFNLLVLIDVAFIGLLFSLLFTRFVMVPGMDMEFLRTDLKMNPSTSNIVVLSIENKDTIFFDGGIYNLMSIDSALERYIQSHPEKANTTLVVRSDSDMNLESFLDLCSKAEKVGYSSIQIMGQNPPEAKPFE